MTSPRTAAPTASPVVLLGSCNDAFFCTAVVAMRSDGPGFHGVASGAPRPWSRLPPSFRRGGPPARRVPLRAAIVPARRGGPRRGPRA